VNNIIQDKKIATNLFAIDILIPLSFFSVSLYHYTRILSNFPLH